MILEDGGEVKIYYGASDTVECLAVVEVMTSLNFVSRKIGKKIQDILTDT